MMVVTKKKGLRNDGWKRKTSLEQDKPGGYLGLGHD